MITEEMDRLIRWALEEDFGSGDVTSAAAVPAEALRKAVVVAKEPGILAGIEVAVRVFAHVDPTVRCTPMLHDGDRMEQGAVVLEVEGPARSVLGGRGWR